MLCNGAQKFVFDRRLDRLSRNLRDGVNVLADWAEKGMKSVVVTQFLEGLAESLLKAPNGGAIASFASSGLTSATPQHEMGERMFQLLYATQSIAIDDASRQAKSATQDIDVEPGFCLAIRR